MISSDSESSSVVLVESKEVSDASMRVVAHGTSRARTESLEAAAASASASAVESVGVRSSRRENCTLETTTNPVTSQRPKQSSDDRAKLTDVPVGLSRSRQESAEKGVLRCIFCRKVLSDSEKERALAEKPSETTRDLELESLSRKPSGKSPSRSGAENDHCVKRDRVLRRSYKISDSDRSPDLHRESVDSGHYRVVNVRGTSGVSDQSNCLEVDDNNLRAVEVRPLGRKVTTSPTGDSSGTSPLVGLEELDTSVFRANGNSAIESVQRHRVCDDCRKKNNSNMHRVVDSRDERDPDNSERVQNPVLQVSDTPRDQILTNLDENGPKHAKMVVDLPSNFPPDSPSQDSMRSGMLSAPRSPQGQNESDQCTIEKQSVSAVDKVMPSKASRVNQLAWDQRREGGENAGLLPANDMKIDSAQLRASARHCDVTKDMSSMDQKDKLASFKKFSSSGWLRLCLSDDRMDDLPLDTRIAAQQLASAINQVVDNVTDAQSELVSSIEARRRQVADKRELFEQRLHAFQAEKLKLLRELEKDEAFLERERLKLQNEEKVLDSEELRLFSRQKSSFEILECVRKKFGSFMSLLANRETKTTSSGHEKDNSSCSGSRKRLFSDFEDSENGTAVAAANDGDVSEKTVLKRTRNACLHQAGGAGVVSAVCLAAGDSAAVMDSPTVSAGGRTESDAVQLKISEILSSREGARINSAKAASEDRDAKPAARMPNGKLDSVERPVRNSSGDAISPSPETQKSSGPGPVKPSVEQSSCDPRSTEMKLTVMQDVSLKIQVPSASESTPTLDPDRRTSTSSSATRPRRRLPPRKQMIR